MKSLTNFQSSMGVKEPSTGSRSATPFNGDVEQAEVKPKFTLTFTFGTPMREINDEVLRTVLQYAESNRLQAAELLKINPRTIRRRLGKKSVSGVATQAV